MLTCAVLQMAILTIRQEKMNKLLRKSLQDCNRIIYWFKVNSLSANPKKFQVMITAKMINPINYLTIDNVEVKPKTTICLLGIEIYKLF